MTVQDLSPWEYAAREFEGVPDDIPAATRSPVALAQYLDRRIIRTPAVALVDAALLDVVEGRCDRLIVVAPPQEMKTTLARYTALLALLRNPWLRLGVASYADRLARRIPRWCRDDIRAHPELGLSLAPGQRAAFDWRVANGQGGMYAAGISGVWSGSAIDCVAGETKIVTTHGYTRIRDVNPARLPKVLSWNHRRGCAEWRQVEAFRRVPRRELVEIVTGAGRVLRCTPDHRVYTQDGYREAGLLRRGDRLTIGRWSPGVAVSGVPSDADQSVGGVPGLPGGGCASGAHADLLGVRGVVPAGPGRACQEGTRGRRPGVLLASLLGDSPGYSGRMPGVREDAEAVRGAGLPGLQAPGRGDVDVRAMWPIVRPGGRGAGETGPCGATRGPLWPGLRVGIAADRWPAMRRMRNPYRLGGPAAEVLLLSVQGSWVGAAAGDPGEGLPHLRAGVPAELDPHGALQPGMRGRSSRAADDRPGQFAVLPWPQLRRVVPAHASVDPGAGPASVPRVLGPGSADDGAAPGPAESYRAVPAGGPSHQRAALGQPSREPDHPVHDLPCGAPQVGEDTVSVVRRVRGSGHDVYDIQVEGNRNFFADEVLVHNCLIIDDPIKGREQADSPMYREKVWDWWESTASARLSEGAPVCLITTRWHHDDLAGRLMKEHPGEWRVVHIPAQSDPEVLDPDPLGRAPGEFMLSARGRTVESWEKRKATAGAQWQPLYQGAPSAPGGEFFAVDKLRFWREPRDAGRQIVCGQRVWRLDTDCWIFATVDPAGTATKAGNDYTVVGVWAIPLDGSLVLLDLARERIPGHRHMHLARPLIERWGCKRIFVEPTLRSTQLVREAAAAGWPVEDVIADKSKEVRAGPLAQRVDDGLVWLPAEHPHLAQVVRELREFPVGAHDDIVDVAAYAAAVEYRRYAPPQPLPARRGLSVGDLVAVRATDGAGFDPASAVF